MLITNYQCCASQELSTAGCELADLSTHKWSRLGGLSTHKWSRLYAYLVAPLIKSLYLPVEKSPVVGAAPNGDNPAGCHPTGLHLLPTAGFSNPRKPGMPTATIKKVRAIALTLGSLALGTAAAVNAQAATVMGMRSCGKWIEARSENTPSRKGWASLAAEAWLVGYMSGLADGLSIDFLKGTDGSSLYLWVDNYCRSNPLKDTADAGYELAKELIKQKRQ